MLKKSHKILDIFAKNPTIAYLYKEIKDQTKNRSESYTYNSLKSFVNGGILAKEKRGGVSFYNMKDTPDAISFLSMVSEYKAWSKKELPLESIKELTKKIPTNYFTLLVVGSYVKGNQTSESDLDIILIVQDNTKRIRSELTHFCEMNIPKIHLYVFTDEEFRRMLLDKRHNYGKEAVKDNLIFYGAEAYYRILMGAVKNGFTY